MALSLENIEDLQIVHWPDSVLTKRCRWVEFPVGNLPRLASRMLKLIRLVGIGLAAPQVGLPLRMFVWNVAGDEGAVVNPILSDPTGEDTLVEGCLSLPGVNIEVRRPMSISMSGMSVNGDTLPRRRADGLLARVWQHEYDHLDGLTLVQRMSAADKIGSKAALRSLKLTAKRADRRKRKG